MDEQLAARFRNSDPLDPQLQYSNYTSGYKKLVEEASLITDRSSIEARRKNGKTWDFLSKVLFSHKKIDDAEDIEVQKGHAMGSGGKEDSKRKKRSSSWLPDPDNRWPVQGW